MGDTDHLKRRFDVHVGWNPDALTWVANANYAETSITTEGATPDRALAAMVGRVEAARERADAAGVDE